KEADIAAKDAAAKGKIQIIKDEPESPAEEGIAEDSDEVVEPKESKEKGGAKKAKSPKAPKAAKKPTAKAAAKSSASKEKSAS
ncbi:MAG: hypothetical protein EBZ49_18825, partial [Proteobacteria bacterium]|nr:hypothetical protein [Pseudomonadota bacterium]